MNPHGNQTSVSDKHYWQINVTKAYDLDTLTYSRNCLLWPRCFSDRDDDFEERRSGLEMTKNTSMFLFELNIRWMKAKRWDMLFLLLKLGGGTNERWEMALLSPIFSCSLLDCSGGLLDFPCPRWHDMSWYDMTIARSMSFAVNEWWTYASPIYLYLSLILISRLQFIQPSMQTSFHLILESEN